MQHVFFFFTCFDLLEEKNKTGGSVLLGFTEMYDLVLIILKHFQLQCLLEYVVQNINSFVLRCQYS